jgi:UDP-glucose 4-epimerase
MKEKVLITGASGFVGYHLIEEALKNNLDVYAAVRKSSNIEHLKALNIQYTYPNFNSVDDLVAELEQKQYTYIIHAAGITKAKTQADYDKVNATYTHNLALAATKANINLKKLVFLSSLACMGPLPSTEGVITEDRQANPVTAYGKSKLKAEQLLSTVPNLPLITLRPTAVYGPRERDLLIIFKKFAQGLEPYIGRVNQQLSFIYVTDLAQITVKALFSPVTGESFNLSDGQLYNRYQLANYTKLALGRKTLRFHIPLGIIRALAFLLEKAYAKSNAVPALNVEKLNELTAANWAAA